MTPRGQFQEIPSDRGSLFRVRPAAAPVAFLAAAVLLAGMFGLPALAVLVSPTRHDPVSLAAALCALLVVGLAAVAIRRARRGRTPRDIRADAEAVTWQEGRATWPEITDLRVVLPRASRAAAPGIHALAAGIAAQQQAMEARLILRRRDGTETLLAPALEASVAEALREALLRHRPAQF